MRPRQPDGTELNDKGDLITTENLPARISFAPSIEQCFIGIYPNVSHYFERHHIPYMVFYVYRLRATSLVKYLDQEEVLANVHDAHVTEEVCVSTSCRVDKISKIKILNCIKNPEILYRKFNNPDNPEEFLCHQIEWSHLERFRPSQLAKHVKLNDVNSQSNYSRICGKGARIK